MSAGLIDRVTDEQLHAERTELLARIGMSEEELIRRGDAWTLATEEQWQALSRLENIRFLLELDD
ncbi:hypothetical protein [Nesterenkonia xinjiangensis]|uniref:Uncharacterized protein n=1 Tax=Nesterenkonia xinjiangensis TaxID=225327 RepID=A0A7Z0KC37_9MICC|nr:hypothetical protein [Nesterenkonia xinjiangensis]NYJ78247.1 hypothetical protein [Nesterenkonia xinjiangensis]